MDADANLFEKSARDLEKNVIDCKQKLSQLLKAMNTTSQEVRNLEVSLYSAYTLAGDILLANQLDEHAKSFCSQYTRIFKEQMTKFQDLFHNLHQTLTDAPQEQCKDVDGKWSHVTHIQLEAHVIQGYASEIDKSIEIIKTLGVILPKAHYSLQKYLTPSEAHAATTIESIARPSSQPSPLQTNCRASRGFYRPTMPPAKRGRIIIDDSTTDDSDESLTVLENPPISSNPPRHSVLANQSPNQQTLPVQINIHQVLGNINAVTLPILEVQNAMQLIKKKSWLLKSYHYHRGGNPSWKEKLPKSFRCKHFRVKLDLDKNGFVTAALLNPYGVQVDAVERWDGEVSRSGTLVVEAIPGYASESKEWYASKWGFERAEDAISFASALFAIRSHTKKIFTIAGAAFGNFTPTTVGQRPARLSVRQHQEAEQAMLKKGIDFLMTFTQQPKGPLYHSLKDFIVED